MNTFKLTSEYAPTGDQPEAIRQLTDGVLAGEPAQTLLGVTASSQLPPLKSMPCLDAAPMPPK